MKLVWFVALGAAFGGVARYWIADAVQQRVGLAFPLGTLVVNVSGSILLGFLMRYALQSAGVTPEMRALLTTGFCGGYTTFSTFSYENAVLLETGAYGRVALYIGASVVLSLAGTFLGFGLAGQLLALRRA